MYPAGYRNSALGEQLMSEQELRCGRLRKYGAWGETWWAVTGSPLSIGSRMWRYTVLPAVQTLYEVYINGYELLYVWLSFHKWGDLLT